LMSTQLLQLVTTINMLIIMKTSELISNKLKT
jgi:hypothetical protein